MANVLIIDDDVDMCRMLSELVKRIHHSATCAHSLEAGLEKALSGKFDAVFLDIRMPDGNGLDILNLIRRTGASPEVIIMTGVGDPDGAEIAIQNGAWDYLQKPLSPKKIILPLNRVLQYRDSLKKIKKPSVAVKREGIIGNSPKLMACLDIVAQAAISDANILVTGETGTGKELFAKAIHHNSPIADNNFVVVDCAALPETLVESTIFGHEKGAFTGADRSKDGLIRQADGGTLFLDEVGELSLPLQKAFLRVLQERRYRPVGSKQELKSNFRLISATNRDLDKMAGKGLFRKDLLFRLRTIAIELPALRQRIEDVKELAVYHTMNVCHKYGIETKGFSSDFFEILCTYEWPGNVRELFGTLEEAINRARYEPVLFPQHLPVRIRASVAKSSVETDTPSFPESIPGSEQAVDSIQIPQYRTFRETVLAKAERKYFLNLIEQTKGDIKKACRISGLGRSRLYALLKKHRVSRLGWDTQ